MGALQGDKRQNTPINPQLQPRPCFVIKDGSVTIDPPTVKVKEIID